MDAAAKARPRVRQRAVRSGLVAACVVLLLALARLARDPPGHGAPEPAGAGFSNAVETPARLDGSREAATRTAAESSGGAEDATSTAPVATTSAGTETIEGVLRVSDEADLVHEKEDGSFLLVAEDEDEGRTIEVRGGMWRAAIRPRVGYRVENVLAGGRPAVSGQYDQPRRRADGDGWEVVARWIRPTVLVVRGLDTGVDLAGVDVAADALTGGLGGCHPGTVEEEQWIARDARSPLVVPSGSDDRPQPGTRTLYVRAPGYAWGCVRVPESLGGEYLVALAPGGALDVLVDGLGASHADAQLRLRPATVPEAEPALEERIGSRTLVPIEGLETGRWLVTVELGHRYRWPRVLARGEVDVAVGGLAHLELDVEEVPIPVRAPLAGRVLASPGWGLEKIELRFELLNDAPRGGARGTHSSDARRSQDPSIEGHEVWEWSVEDGVMPGRWSVDFPRLGLGLAVDVPPGGRGDVNLEIPEPVDVLVLTVDANSGLPVTDARLSWMPVRTWSNAGGRLLDTHSLGEGRFSLRAPRGRIDLWCFPERHRFLRETIDAEPPRSERVLRLDQACGFILRVRDGSTLLPWPMQWGWSREIRRVGGEGEGWMVDQDANLIETRFVVTTPGRYRLEFPSPPGYAPLPPQEFDVPHAAFTRHDLVLTRP